MIERTGILPIKVNCLYDLVYLRMYNYCHLQIIARQQRGVLCVSVCVDAVGNGRAVYQLLKLGADIWPKDTPICFVGRFFYQIDFCKQ